jgi:excisionase family DNA binding protein
MMPAHVVAVDSLPTPRLLAPRDVATWLGVSRSMVYGLIRKGDLVAVRVGRLPRIEEKAVEEYIHRKRASVP